MMREQGPERRLWEELNTVERNEFNYMEPVCFKYLCLSVHIYIILAHCVTVRLLFLVVTVILSALETTTTTTTNVMD